MSHFTMIIFTNGLIIMFMRDPKQMNFQREIIHKFKPIPKIVKIVPFKDNPLHAICTSLSHASSLW